MCIYIYIYIHIIYIYIHICIYIYIYIMFRRPGSRPPRRPSFRRAVTFQMKALYLSYPRYISISLSLSLYIHIYIYIYICLFIHPSIHLYIYIRIHTYIFPHPCPHWVLTRPWSNVRTVASGCVSKAVTPRCLGVTPRATHKSPSSRATHYYTLPSDPPPVRKHLHNARTPQRQVER